MPTEQDRILDHAPGRHGRILAGPGTGKSTTVLEFAQRLHESDPPIAVGIVTFTRAATAELAEKIHAEGHDLVQPSTLHSFALSLLMRNPGFVSLPIPLRIPDDWEMGNLIEPDIAFRLRRLGQDGVSVRTVRKLDREMAAGWESLDPDTQLLADLDPELRNAYVAVWRSHRAVFGYSMFAEIPFSAAHLLEDHPDAARSDTQLLIVDEFQDLNRAEIHLAEALAAVGVSVLAVGDDEQSIYSFRMADPSGILEFPEILPDVVEYTLSVSYRCGTNILSAARAVIESGPDRRRDSRITPGPGNPPGEFKYLRFPSAVAEQLGVGRLVKHLIAHEHVTPNDIVIMMRGDSNDVWSAPVRDALSALGVQATDVEQAIAPLSETSARRLIAVAHIISDRNDSLAWWTYLKLTSGISDAYLRALTDEAMALGQTFVQRLMHCTEQAPSGVSAATHGRVVGAIADVEAILARVDLEHVAPSDEGWATWLLDLSDELGIEVQAQFGELARSVGREVPQRDGLGHYLNQLEPIAKDNALRADGVAIMTMTRSKGLTFRAAIVMGVEEGVVPSPRAVSEDEERRLLYVAMTRAKEWCYLTMASRRYGPTGYSGQPNPGTSRGRCPLLQPLGAPLQPQAGNPYLDGLGA
jgi:DNA helicase-2/ATP-dependent DNA helicase PcrA